MKFNHFILENIFWVLGGYAKKKSRFRILNVHDILDNDFDKLEKILINLKKNWQFIDPSKLNELEKNINKNYLLLTFDDGYKSQKIFADKILDKHNIKAIFFVVTNFLNCTNKEEAKEFVLKNIDKNIEKNLNRYKEIDNMNNEDLLKLKSNKHVIGSHTVNHKKLTEIKNLEELEFEICESKKRLENLLCCPIDYFAYTYGDIGSINKDVFTILKKNYKNIFSGIRGDNFLNKSFKILLRDELSPHYSTDLVNSFLNGYSDFYYYKNRKNLFSLDKNA
jgi:peptidoglycan/xylan/chitin deacetylase (PgdA/CDA1 family)